MRPVMMVMARIITMAGRICFTMGQSSRKADGGHEHVDELDADERDDNAAKAVDQKIAPQDAGGTHWTIGHAPQCQRNERDDDERVEDDRREDGALRSRQVHDVERLKLRIK